MARTKRNAMLIEEAREKIRTTQLINRLQDHALGKVDMSSTQVRSVEILLKKRIPDLTASDNRHEHDTTDDFKKFLDAISGGARPDERLALAPEQHIQDHEPEG